MATDRLDPATEGKLREIATANHFLPPRSDSYILDALRECWLEAQAEQRAALTLDDLNIICGACNILDVVKTEWGKEGCWSEWDQSIRDGLTEILRRNSPEAIPAQGHAHAPEGRKP